MRFRLKGRTLFFFLTGLAVTIMIFWPAAVSQERLVANKTNLRTNSLLVVSRTTLLAVGDSLTQGTRDAINDQYFLQNAYLQKLAEKLSHQEIPYLSRT